MRHVADRVDVDQRSDTRDQQQEHRRQRVVEQVHADVEPADIDPVVEVLGDLPVAVVPPEHAEEADQADHERADRQSGAEVVTPLVGVLAAEQQHRGAEQRQRDDQPQQREDAVGLGRRDHGDVVLRLGRDGQQK